jgi:4-amino-4-deoxy-L-arabinose transferase-like glycosyltransferase
MGLAVVVVLIIIIRSNFLEIPFERDEGSYAYAGKIILNGAKPFIDIGSQRLDGVFYAYAVMVAIFGYTLKSLHIGFLIVNLITTVLLFFTGKKLSNKLTGLAAALFFALLSMNPFASGFTIQSEHLVICAAVAGFLSLLYFFDRKKVILLVASGVLFSIAFLLKQTSAFFGLFAGLLLVFKLYFTDKESLKKVVLYAFLFSAAAILPVAIDILQVYLIGAWSDFHLWFFDIRKQYSSFLSFSRGKELFLINWSFIFKDYGFLWIISILGSVTVFFTSLETWKKLAVAGFHLFAFATIIPGYHFYGHYYLQWIPAASLSGGFFIFSIYDIIRNRLKWSFVAAPIAIAMMIIPALVNLNKLNGYYFNPDSTQVLRNVYGMNPFPESKVIADKLNELMKDEDKLAIFGTEIQMYFYTNKISPSRFAGSGVLLEFPVSQTKAWQQEFISDVEKANPKYVVFFSLPTSWMKNPKTEDLIFPWFNQFFLKYNVIGYVEMLDNSANYVWAPNVNLSTNPPKSNNVIYVFERK